MQFVAARQETSYRSLKAGLGAETVRRVHALPFHVWLIAMTWPEAFANPPAARHALAAAHETPARWARSPALGLEVRLTFQLVPFHNIAVVPDGTCGPRVARLLPTAMQRVPLRQ